MTARVTSIATPLANTRADADADAYHRAIARHQHCSP
jgi:hypothetical protein